MSAAASYHVAILGCGVIGLSTALAILEDQIDKPHAGTKTFVTIVSKEVPDVADLDVPHTLKAARRKPSAEYASIWAGGHHVSDAKTEQGLRHDKITFERMSKLARERPWASNAAESSPTYGAKSVLPVVEASASSAPSPGRQPEPLVWVHQTELFETTNTSQQSSSKAPYEGVLDWYPDFKPLPASSLSHGIGWGCTFSTIDINVPFYHKWLLRRFLDLGGRLVIAEAKSLQDAIRLSTSPSANTVICKNAPAWSSAGKVSVLVASPGLGARTLIGIQDDLVHPQRGQVVVINAPWLSTSLTLPASSPQPRYTLPGFSVVRATGGREVYIIPRGDGTVICGGTRIVGDFDPHPRPETTKKILERCLALVPQLANPKKWNGLAPPRVEDVEVVGVNVGLRPARTGGVRLERARDDVDGVKVVYNYGYGGWGYQASWGAALEAKQLVEEALGTPMGTSSPVPPAKL